jgi:lincosamide nucleotidyltransferase A/C/D/E
VTVAETGARHRVLLFARRIGRVPSVKRWTRSRLALRVWRQLLARNTGAIHDLLHRFALAGVPVWLAGGWGVDALLGRPTRRHDDIDLVVPKGYEEMSSRILEEGGYKSIDEEFRTTWFPHRITWRNDLGQSIDLLPVAITETPEPVTCTAESFAIGQLGGRAVACLSPQMQLQLHSGYELRPIDRTDVALLCQLVGQAVPAEFE